MAHSRLPPWPAVRSIEGHYDPEKPITILSGHFFRDASCKIVTFPNLPGCDYILLLDGSELPQLWYNKRRQVAIEAVSPRHWPSRRPRDDVDAADNWWCRLDFNMEDCLLNTNRCKLGRHPQLTQKSLPYSSVYPVFYARFNLTLNKHWPDVVGSGYFHPLLPYNLLTGSQCDRERIRLSGRYSLAVEAVPDVTSYVRARRHGLIVQVFDAQSEESTSGSESR